MSKNLYKAMEIEQGYLDLISDVDAKNKYNYTERLELAGYKTIYEYNDDKKGFLLKLENNFIGYSDPSTNIKDVLDAIKIDNTGIMVVAPNKKWLYVGNTDVDDSLCADNNVTKQKIRFHCDPILSSEKDLNLVIVSKADDLQFKYMEWLSNELKAVGIDNRVEKDNLFIQDKKIAGSSYNSIRGYTVYYFQVYFEIDTELMKKLHCAVDYPLEGITKLTGKTRQELLDKWQL